MISSFWYLCTWSRANLGSKCSTFLNVMKLKKYLKGAFYSFAIHWKVEITILYIIWYPEISLSGRLICTHNAVGLNPARHPYLCCGVRNEAKAEKHKQQTVDDQCTFSLNTWWKHVFLLFFHGICVLLDMQTYYRMYCMYCLLCVCICRSDNSTVFSLGEW